MIGFVPLSSSDLTRGFTLKRASDAATVKEQSFHRSNSPRFAAELAIERIVLSRWTINKQVVGIGEVNA